MGNSFAAVMLFTPVSLLRMKNSQYKVRGIGMLIEGERLSSEDPSSLTTEANGTRQSRKLAISSKAHLLATPKKVQQRAQSMLRRSSWLFPDMTLTAHCTANHLLFPYLYPPRQPSNTNSIKLHSKAEAGTSITI